MSINWLSKSKCFTVVPEDETTVIKLAFLDSEDSPQVKQKRKRKRKEVVEVGNTPTPQFVKVTQEEEGQTKTQLDPEAQLESITLKEDFAFAPVKKPEVR